MTMKWDDLRLFLAVCEQGSMSGAARVLKLGQPTLSRRMGELEELVGEPLLVRQTHGIVLTDAGERLLPAARRMAEWANDAALALSKAGRNPVGKVRIAAPPGVAFEFVAPLAFQIRDKYPTLQIEVLSAIETLNLGRGEADLSLRTSMPTHADLECIDQVSTPIRAYVSRTYATKLAPKPCIADLHWICWSPPYDKLAVNQELEGLIPNFKPAFTSDDINVQLAACRAGVGAMVLPRAPHRFSQLHELHELDLDLGPAAIGSLYLVCHKRHRHLTKVQVVIDAISAEFEFMRSKQVELAHTKSS